MTRWIGAAMLAASLMFGCGSATDTAAAASLQAGVQQPRASDATNLSARRRIRNVRRYAYQSYDRPYYYDRPTYYRPYPYAVPVPFFLGFGFGPWW